MDSHQQHAYQVTIHRQRYCSVAKCWSQAGRTVQCLRLFHRTVDIAGPRCTIAAAQAPARHCFPTVTCSSMETSFRVMPASSTTHLPTSGRGHQGQCGNNVSFGPLVLLGTGKVLLAGDLITYSGHTSPTTRCALYDPATNTWTATGSLLQATRRTATLLPNGKVLSVGE